MNKEKAEKLLNELITDLENKTDEEIIQEYKNIGIDIIGYNPNEKGSIIFKDLVVEESDYDYYVDIPKGKTKIINCKVVKS
jgi:hypothetical protein